MAEQDSGWWFLKTMVRKGRIASGKSQSKVGDAVYRSKDTILAWETGKTDIPVLSIEKLAKAIGISEESKGYMEAVAEARRKGNAIEADMRFNAIFLALAEEYCGHIFKFEMSLIPGPLQIREYHDEVVRKADPRAADKNRQDGWGFKEERAATLEARLAVREDRPTLHFLIGEGALLLLRRLSEELYQSQMTHLRKWARKPGVSIRILRDSVPARLGSFSIYLPENSRLACPPFVYTEIADSSWCIDDVDRIARYDDIRKMLWKMAIRIEGYHDDDGRDRLA